jgi:hypothetical protein
MWKYWKLGEIVHKQTYAATFEDGRKSALKRMSRQKVAMHVSILGQKTPAAPSLPSLKQVESE